MLLDADHEERQAVVSPDGRWIAYLSDETGDVGIYVRPFPNIGDGKWLVSTNNGFQPLWSPSGRELFYLSPGNVMVAQIETEPTFSALTPEPLFSWSGYLLGVGGGRQFDIAPDGERFIVPKRGGLASDDQTSTGLIFVDNWFEELKERVPIP